MNLLLDIGNSSLKWAQEDDTTLLASGSALHRDADFESLANSAWQAIETPQSVVVSNVAGNKIAAALTAWTEQHWRLTPRFVRATRYVAGLTNAYAQPEALGIDRWAAMLGARRDYPGALCVVDCGTAITVDHIESSGVHRGGLILAGIDMMQQALRRGTANLRTTGATHDVTLHASNTDDAIASGSVYAAAAAIDRIAGDVASASNETLCTVLTGGDAVRVLPLMRITARHDADLVLKGLAVLAGER
jgi:type III pantothenate kinase